MGFAEEDRVNARLKASPTGQLNNLAGLDDTLYFAHLDQVWTVSGASAAKGGEGDDVDAKGRPIARCSRICDMVSGSDRMLVRQIAPVSLYSGQSYIALATSIGVEVFDGSGRTLILHWNLPADDRPRDHTLAPTATCVAWASGPDGAVHLCVGTAGGRIHVFVLDSFGRISHADTMYTPDFEPVSCIGSHMSARRGGDAAFGERPVLVVGTYEGTSVLYQATGPGEYDVIRQVREGAPVVGCAAWGDFAVVGAQNGTVALHSISRGITLGTYRAHSRMMSCLALHPTKGLIATGAEDATVAVWELPTSSAEIRMPLSACWQSSVVTGVAFRGDDLAVVPYDHEEIALYKHQP
ncbi:unnamed protein product [Pedinophyceae sp. YPF-701]|nr:unnamed protein product [Pedinophyceae sp. YPF-701]